MRHSISLLEAYVFPNQRPSIPHRRTSDAASLNVVPKKEYIDLDVHGEKTHAPGMLGTHTQGGLYAGPTSAATHLLMVGSSPPFRAAFSHLFFRRTVVTTRMTQTKADTHHKIMSVKTSPR